jgi:iron complex transport system substrate-binding protein
MKRTVIILAAMFITAGLRAEIITDDVGRKAEMQIPAKTVVCLSPAHTEMIYWLNCGDRLKAVSSNCDYPAEAKTLPQAGTFMSPDIEAIVKIKPDVVLSGGGIQKKAIAAMEKLGINVLVMYPRDIRGIISDMEIIAKLLGCKDSGKKISGFADKVNKKAKTPAVKVYAELWGGPAMGVGGESFINDIIERAGGINILKDAKSEFPKVSTEEVVKRQPDVIILLYKPEKDYMARQYFKMTPAGKAGRIYCLKQVDLDCSLRPGPRIDRAINTFEKIIDNGREK